MADRIVSLTTTMPGGNSSQTATINIFQPPSFSSFKFKIIGKQPSLLNRISDLIADVPGTEVDDDPMQEDYQTSTLGDNSVHNEAINEGRSLLSRIQLSDPHDSEARLFQKLASLLPSSSSISSEEAGLPSGDPLNDVSVSAMVTDSPM